MGLFDKSKKYKEINDQNRRQIVQLIEQIRLNVRKDPQVLQLLSQISNEIQGQAASSSKEITKLDVQILSLLNEVNSDVIKGHSTIAVNKLDKVATMTNDRRQYTVLTGHVSKEQAELQKSIDKSNKLLGNKIARKAEKTKTRVEELQEEIDQKCVEKEELQRQFDRLKERYEKSPDVSIKSQAKVVKQQLDENARDLQNLNKELDYEMTAAAIKKAAEAEEKLVKTRTISEDQIDVNREKIFEANEKRAAEQEQVAKDRELLFGAIDDDDDPFAEKDEATSSDPFSASSKSQAGSFNKNLLGTPEMRAEITKTKAALNMSISKYDEKIDDAEEQLQELNDELKPLLMKRKDASPSECLVLDGKIDEINAKRNGIKYSIKRYRQGTATLQEQLLLMEKLSTQQDLEATQAQIDQITAGKFKDFEGLSLYLKESVETANENLETIGMAGLVASGNDVVMNTFSSSVSEISDSPDNKDESKYDAEMRELGLI